MLRQVKKSGIFFRRIIKQKVSVARIPNKIDQFTVGFCCCFSLFTVVAAAVFVADLDLLLSENPYNRQKQSNKTFLFFHLIRFIETNTIRYETQKKEEENKEKENVEEE